MGRSLRKRPYFSEEFKRAAVRRIEHGELSVAEAGREYGIGGKMTVYRWLARYGSEADAESGAAGAKPERRKPEAKKQDARKQKPMKQEAVQKSQEELRAEVEALKRLLELERLRSEAYLEMIKLAEGRYGIPIEKKSGAKQSER